MKNRIIPAIILCFFSLAIEAQELSYSQYISENIVEFDGSDSIIFSDAYVRYRLFALGEHHYRNENSDFFLAFIKNLYHNANVRVIFMEASFAQGLIVENYLKTGNESSLSKISTYAQFSQNHYKELKKFYDELPDNDKFHVIGIDIDNHDVATNFPYAVKLLLPQEKISKKIKVLLNEFSESALPGDKRNAKIFEEIYLDFANNPEYYKSALNENYNVYKNLLNRVKNTINLKYYDYNFGQDSIPQTMREDYIYNNVINAVKNYPNCNYFTQFGLAHIGLSYFLIIPEEDRIQSYIAKLNTREASPLKDSICSIAILYYSTKFGNINMQNYKILNSIVKVRYANSRKEYLPNKVYRIIKKNTKKGKTYLLKLDKENSPLKDIAEKNFQYLILNR